jgi:signal transduction histidine kinase
VLSIYEGRFKNSNIQVQKRKRAEKPVVCFEADIRQVLSNLVANAIDAMPGGGRLLVRSREATDWMTGRPGFVLTVADTGSGIDAQTQARIFEAFFSTKGFGGTGLGLWISAEIVERHQGRLRVRSSQREGHRGTVVALFLPAEMPTANASAPKI